MSKRAGISLQSIALAFLASALFCEPANAVIKIIGIERASVVKNVTTEAGVNTITVYGGLAGDASRCEGATGGSTSSTCNNCRLLTTETVPPPLVTPDLYLLPCNERRVNPQLLLAITYSSDAIAGTSAVTSKTGTPALTGGTSVAVAKGTSVTVTVPWSSICSQVFTDAVDGGDPNTCIPTNGKASGVIKVGISAGSTGLLNATADDAKDINIIIRSVNGTAVVNGPSLAENCAAGGTDWRICYFDMGPGDAKAIVKTLGDNDVPVPASDYTHLRMLYAETGFSSVTLVSPRQYLPLSPSDTESFKVAPRRIDGLANDRTYYFKSALVDSAGNVSLYSRATNDGDCTQSPTGGSLCRIVTPSEVAGVLDKTNCFIATAAYGTQFALEIDTLRDFRDQILMKSNVGRNFVRFYYDRSPYYARMILESPVARGTVRAALVPVVWFAGFALAYGPLKAVLALLASLVLVAGMLHVGRRPAVRAATRESYNDVKDRARRSLLPLLIGALFIPSLSVQSAEAAKKDRRPSQVAVEDELSEDPFDDASRSNDVAPADDELPPEPEYPYPGASGTTPAPTPRPVVRPRQPSPLERADQKFGTGQRPTAITEDGEYIYERLPETPAKRYGEPKSHKFSERRGVEKPSSIATDGEFTYHVAESPFTGAAGVRFGFMGAPRITNKSNGLTFKQIYGNNDVPGLLFEYEYPLTRKIGRVGLKFESGAYYAQAQGRFLRLRPEVPEEVFTFLMVPLQVMLHYRFQYADNQLFVPFVEGGAAYNGIVELRDDNKTPRIGGAPAFIASGGINILLDWMDRHAIRQLDAEYGINHVWLTVQYRQIIGLKEEIDFTTHLISGGFTFDF